MTFYCPCCNQPMIEDPDDAPFCPGCGLYRREDAEWCDNPKHTRAGNAYNLDQDSE